MDQYVVMVFDQGGDELMVAKYPIRRLSLLQLQHLFGIDESNPMYDCYPVTDRQRLAIEEDTGIRMDLNRYEYHVTCE